MNSLITKHLLLVGPAHSGMTDCLRKIYPVFPQARGFETQCGMADSTGRFPIYIRDLTDAPSVPGTLIGFCRSGRSEPNPDGFLASAERLRTIPDGSLVILNHLGTMEAGAASFRSAVLDLFSRCRVIAALRDLPDPFLLSLRARDDVCCFSADEIPAFLACLQKFAVLRHRSNETSSVSVQTTVLPLPSDE